jgi:hypothetical protein
LKLHKRLQIFIQVKTLLFERGSYIPQGGGLEEIVLSRKDYDNVQEALSSLLGQLEKDTNVRFEDFSTEEKIFIATVVWILELKGKDSPNIEFELNISDECKALLPKLISMFPNKRKRFVFLSQQVINLINGGNLEKIKMLMNTK